MCARRSEADLALADAFLEIQIAEHESGHFLHRNPALWTGEAIFGVDRARHAAVRSAGCAARRGASRACAPFLRFSRRRGACCRRLPACGGPRACGSARRRCRCSAKVSRAGGARVARRRGRVGGSRSSGRWRRAPPLRSFSEWIERELAEAPAATTSVGERSVGAAAPARAIGVQTSDRRRCWHEAREALAAEAARARTPGARRMAAGPTFRSSSRTRIRRSEDYLPRFARIWEALP